MSTNTSCSSSKCCDLTWKIEFDKRIEAFSKAIGVSEDEARKAFAKLGVDGKEEQSLTIIDSDEFMPMNDLFEAFVDSELTQKAKLRAGMPHLRGKTHLGEASDSLNGDGSINLTTVAESIKELAESNRPISSLSDEELLKRYEEGATEVIKILREKSHGRPCIVRNKDESTNLKVSLELLRLAKKQPTTEKYSVDGRLVRVYRIGEFPMKPLDESPFYPGVALVNGFCPQSNTEWFMRSDTGIKNICHEIRVLVRLQTQVNHHSSGREMKQIWKDAKSMSIDQFRTEYAEAALLYEELEEKDQLPKLKIHQGQSQKVDTGF